MPRHFIASRCVAKHASTAQLCMSVLTPQRRRACSPVLPTASHGAVPADIPAASVQNPRSRNTSACDPVCLLSAGADDSISSVSHRCAALICTSQNHRRALFSKCLEATGNPPHHEGTRHAATLHPLKAVQGPDAYAREDDGKIKRGSSLLERGSKCLSAHCFLAPSFPVREAHGWRDFQFPICFQCSERHPLRGAANAEPPSAAVRKYSRDAAPSCRLRHCIPDFGP